MPRSEIQRFLDGLERYLFEAEAHFDELLELVDSETQQRMEHTLPKLWDDFLLVARDPPKCVFVFLSEGPTSQQRRLENLPENHRDLLWLQARFQAYQATTALRLTLDVARMPNRSYRKKVRQVAQAASQLQALPTAEDLVWLRLANERSY
ncbi:MAG: hypothetical protein ACRBB0_25500 [Pelagimonas sp.]|uniref:hypothetical protein n=1 Tax=Pelagimonas sp. TaxID=2073170 RepID=UPI003D6BE2CF